MGFQHFIVMLGTTVFIPIILVPVMGGDVEKAEVIDTVLFVAGTNTLLQTWFGTRLHVVMGASYTFIIPALSIAYSRRFSVFIDPHQVQRNYGSNTRSTDNWFILSQYASAMKLKIPIFERFAILFSVAIVWVYAEILTAGGAYNHRSPRTQSSCRTDRSGLVRGAPWVRVPYPFQWGRPYFHAGDTFAVMASAFVAIIEVKIRELIIDDFTVPYN